MTRDSQATSVLLDTGPTASSATIEPTTVTTMSASGSPHDTASRVAFATSRGKRPGRCSG